MSNENENEKQQQPSEAQEAQAPVEGVAPTEASSEEKKEPKKVPPKAAAKSESGESPAVKEKPVAAKAAAEAPKKEQAPPPPPPEPGRYGQLLMANGFSPTALGKDATGIEIIELKSVELRDACRFLRDSSASQFDLLVSVSGVDWKDRLEAVYHLYSTKTFDKVALKATAVDEKLPSVVSVWQTADWHERETYDLFGIVFEGHPNLTRILMPSDWIGYPMRKDYKVDDPRLVWNER